MAQPHGCGERLRFAVLFWEPALPCAERRDGLAVFSGESQNVTILEPGLGELRLQVRPSGGNRTGALLFPISLEEYVPGGRPYPPVIGKLLEHAMEERREFRKPVCGK
jgi:hypothetical protein